MTFPFLGLANQTGVLQSELRLTGNTILPRVRSECKTFHVDSAARGGILSRKLPGAIANAEFEKILRAPMTGSREIGVSNIQ
jgi:hypothetical protein